MQHEATRPQGTDTGGRPGKQETVSGTAVSGTRIAKCRSGGRCGAAVVGAQRGPGGASWVRCVRRCGVRCGRSGVGALYGVRRAGQKVPVRAGTVSGALGDGRARGGGQNSGLGEASCDEQSRPRQSRSAEGCLAEPGAGGWRPRRPTERAAGAWEPLSDTDRPADRSASLNALASVYVCRGTTTIHKLCVSPVEELHRPPFHVKRDLRYRAVHGSIHSRRKRSTSRFT